MSQIKLGSEVRVSDPCYGDDVWCKTTLSNVLPGNYGVIVENSDEGSWGVRNSSIIVTHEDYTNKRIVYEEYGGIGVDSGQAGIFCESSYRNDEVAKDIVTPESDFEINPTEPGDQWYNKMCRMTLTGDGWGTYESGVVSSSGYGDGSYPLTVAKNNDGKIVSIAITFIGEDDEDEWDEDEEDEWDEEEVDLEE